MSGWRARPQNLWGTHDPCEFATTLKYRTDDPPEAVESENYFLPCQVALKPGDEIHVSSMLDDGSWAKALYEVAYKDQFRVVVERIGEWRRGGLRPVMELKAEHRGHGSWDVIYADSGKPHSRGVDKATAERLVGHRLGAGAEKAA